MIIWPMLLVALALWTVLYRLRRRRMYKLASAIPEYSKSLPIIGVAHLARGNVEELMCLLQSISNESMQFDGLIKIWLNHLLLFLVTNPEDSEMILKTCLEKDDLHRFLRKVSGNGVVFAPVSIWRRRRKVILPAFSPKILDSFFDVFLENSKKLVENLGSTVNNGKFSIWPYLSSCTLDAICETAMGIKMNAQSDSNLPFLVSVNSILDIVCKRLYRPWQHPDWLFKFFPVYAQHEKHLRIIQTFTDSVIEKKRAQIQKNKGLEIEVDNQFNLDDYKRKSFLDLLITLSGGERGYTNVELREEIITLIVAGMDTSAVTVGFVLQLLGKYPEIQDKVYKEIYNIFGDLDRAIVKEDLLNLKYLERVMKESLRLFPPGPFVVRKVETDIMLPSGRTLPQGSGVIVSIWGCHHDPKYWGPDAEHFDPDRFLPERLNLKHPCNFIPFSNGPRNCVGYQYAIMSIKIMLMMILRSYKVIGEREKGPIPKIRTKLNIMMKPIDDELAFEERNPERKI